MTTLSRNLAPMGRAAVRLRVYFSHTAGWVSRAKSYRPSETTRFWLWCVRDLAIDFWRWGKLVTQTVYRVGHVAVHIKDMVDLPF